MQNLTKPRSTSTSWPKPDGETDKAQFGDPFAPMPEDSASPASGSAATAAGSAQVMDVSRPTAPDSSHQPYKLKLGRYRRIVFFFVLLFVRTIGWEVVIRRLAGEEFVIRGRSERWRRYARQFRKLAVEMGGVMIKLGQFISSRMDVLPPEITEELAGLQDQVPIVPFDYIKTTIQRELGPIEEKFMWLNPEPVAAASFGQVHRAQLPNGDRVVVKVQRPNINDIVHTDLSALNTVARLAMRYGPIRRRANVPDLLEEFSRVLWEELDYIKEADHAMVFSSMFEADPGIYVPSVYLTHTTHLVLTLEDVTSIKLNDYTAIEKAGIDRREVASRLLNCYLRQIFDHRFFHADPHPGNLFIYPLPENSEGDKPAKSNGNGSKGKQPFYLIFVDFGMVGRLTPRLQEGLRETLIAVVTQDAKALVASYHKLGVLLPGTDMERLEEATRVVFGKVWGLNMTQMANLPFEEMADVAREFSDLLISMPFQMPQDFIYLSRATGILSGMCTGLDPNFDPWREMQPFTQRILGESKDGSPVQTTVANTRAALQVGFTLVRDLVTRAYKLPSLADNVLTRADQGKLAVKVLPDENVQRQLNRIESATSQIAIGVIFATLTLASTLLYINREQTLGVIGFGMSAVTLLMILLRGRS
jgi:predicted unusual protein kinase regulating ubiquinone biosynthesis (AarF/ABC1/UbiB family)